MRGRFGVLGRDAEYPIHVSGRSPLIPLWDAGLAKVVVRRANEVVFQAVSALASTAPPALTALQLEPMRHAPRVRPCFEEATNHEG